MQWILNRILFSEKGKICRNGLIRTRKYSQSKNETYWGFRPVQDRAGSAIAANLVSMPHLLIAGTTGSGKSVCITSIATCLAINNTPADLKIVMIDPKMVEMTGYSTIPHLMAPIVTETQQAVKILEWATVKMDERYSILAEARVKNISEYNKLGPEQIIERFAPSSAEEEAKIPKRLHYIVIVIDELADLLIQFANIYCRYHLSSGWFETMFSESFRSIFHGIGPAVLLASSFSMTAALSSTSMLTDDAIAMCSSATFLSGLPLLVGHPRFSVIL